jgi:hypothetical protein
MFVVLVRQLPGQAADGRFHACYVPATGTVYRILEVNTPTACRAGQTEFSWLPSPAQVNSSGPALSIANAGSGPAAQLSGTGTGAAAILSSASSVALQVSTLTGFSAANFDSHGDGNAVYAHSVGQNLAAGAFENANGPALSALSRGPASANAFYAESHCTSCATVAFANKGGSNAIYAESNSATFPAAAIVNLGTADALLLRSAGPEALTVASGATVNGNLHVNGRTDLGGDLVVEGQSVVVGGTKSAVVPTSSGMRELYTEESAEVWFTDYGVARLQNGRAWVALDQLFAETIESGAQYLVFVQPYGAANLYVPIRQIGGFEVRVAQGDSATEFAYRIVAKRKGFADRRLRTSSDPARRP